MAGRRLWFRAENGAGRHGACARTTAGREESPLDSAVRASYRLSVGGTTSGPLPSTTEETLGSEPIQSPVLVIVGSNLPDRLLDRLHVSDDTFA